MARTPSTENQPSKRRSRGFAAASYFAKAPLRNAAARRGIAETRLVTQWPEIAGPSLARLSRPLRVKHDRGGHGLGGVLILAVDGPRATEVEMAIPQIIERVNGYYGYRAIADVRLTQASSTATAVENARKIAAEPQPADLPSAKRHALEELTDPIGDDALRSALTRLGANVMSRGKVSSNS